MSMTTQAIPPPPSLNQLHMRTHHNPYLLNVEHHCFLVIPTPRYVVVGVGFGFGFLEVMVGADGGSRGEGKNFCLLFLYF